MADASFLLGVGGGFAEAPVGGGESQPTTPSIEAGEGRASRRAAEIDELSLTITMLTFSLILVG